VRGLRIGSQPGGCLGFRALSRRRSILRGSSRTFIQGPIKMKEGRTHEMTVVVEAQRITKEFPAVRALDEVTFCLERAAIYGLVGENGAGKSTLLNILFGVFQATRGELKVAGEKADIRNPAQAREQYGIDGVFQSPTCIPTLSVAENMFLGEEAAFHKRGLIDFRKLHDRAGELLSAVGLDIDVTLPAGRLSPAELKLVEFAKALSHDPEIMILDEVTAALERDDIRRLFEIMRNLKREGKTVIFVSHRLREVLEVTDSCLVLRDGRLVGSVKTHDVKEDDLIELMTGQRKGLTFPERDTGKRWEETQVVLSARGLDMSKPAVLKDVDIDLRRGEIVALAGLRGQGQSDLLRCIAGLIPDYRGRIYVDGKEVEMKEPASAIRRGVVHISDNKEKEELCLTLSVLRNFALAKLSSIPRGLIRLKKEIQDAEAFRSMFGIETPSLHQQVLNLSGGNRQKVVLSKWIRMKPRVMLADQPTAGLDVGAKMDVYRILRELANEGLSILTVLTEMEEVLNLPDRVLVMREGQIVRQLSSQGLNEDELLRSYFEK